MLEASQDKENFLTQWCDKKISCLCSGSVLSSTATAGRMIDPFQFHITSSRDDDRHSSSYHLHSRTEQQSWNKRTKIFLQDFMLYIFNAGFCYAQDSYLLRGRHHCTATFAKQKTQTALQLGSSKVLSWSLPAQLHLLSTACVSVWVGVHVPLLGCSLCRSCSALKILWQRT